MINDLLQALILGIVQGITEWLPISSSGHLVLFQELFGLSQPVVFDVFLHLGSLIVILLVFWKDIKKLVNGFFKWEKYYVKYVVWLMVASVPIAFVGYFLNDFVKLAFTDLRIVGVSLIFTAIVLFLSKYPKVKKRELTWRSIVVIGIAQALAILPGVSRSGMTISSGLMQGTKSYDIARFSFLLFIPAILGATLLEFRHLGEVSNMSALLLGTLTTVVVGFFSLKLLLNIIKKQKFNYFGWYCLVLGIVVLLIV